MKKEPSREQAKKEGRRVKEKGGCYEDTVWKCYNETSVFVHLNNNNACLYFIVTRENKL